MKIKLALLLAAILPACTPLSEDPVLNALGERMQRASAYEQDGYTPGDAWQRTAPTPGFGNPGLNTPGFGNPGFGTPYSTSPFSGSGLNPATIPW